MPPHPILQLETRASFQAGANHFHTWAQTSPDTRLQPGQGSGLQGFLGALPPSPLSVR